MYRFYFCIFCFGFPQIAFTQTGLGDRLIFENDTAWMRNYLSSFVEDNDDMFVDLSAECRRNCGWGGYLNLWELKSDSLFYLGRSCRNDSRCKVLSETPVFAFNYSDTLYVLTGQRLYAGGDWGPLYDYETAFVISNGILTSSELLDNTASFKSEYFKSVDVLHEFFRDRMLQSDLNFAQIAEDDLKKTIIIRFEILDETGRAMNVSVARAGLPSLNDLAMQMIRDLPSWAAFYQRGELQKRAWLVPVNFYGLLSISE
ncbi:MAG: hypothetical protein AAGF87_13090 [Bacteroidota bacterium]